MDSVSSGVGIYSLVDRIDLYEKLYFSGLTFISHAIHPKHDGTRLKKRPKITAHFRLLGAIQLSILSHAPDLAPTCTVLYRAYVASLKQILSTLVVRQLASDG